MKNLYLLPMEKPSKLQRCSLSEWFDISKKSLIDDRWNYQNLYITNDEEIKNRDFYYLPRTNTVHKCKEENEINLERKLGIAKVVLTTDSELIEQGVQEIDDEFLEWFVKNPSCEEVKIENDYLLWKNSEKEKLSDCYKIIIPKEEFEQETLEEAVERLYPLLNVPDGSNVDWVRRLGKREGFLKGSEWQKQQMYSEEEVISLLYDQLEELDFYGSDFKFSEWFEKVKKQ